MLFRSPVLEIFKMRRSLSAYSSTRMLPLSGVYLKALDRRFPAILMRTPDTLADSQRKKGTKWKNMESRTIAPIAIAMGKKGVAVMVVADYKGEYSQQNYYIILITWHVVAFFSFHGDSFSGRKKRFCPSADTPGAVGAVSGREKRRTTCRLRF